MKMNKFGSWSFLSCCLDLGENRRRSGVVKREQYTPVSSFSLPASLVATTAQALFPRSVTCSCCAVELKQELAMQ
jgi:NADH:ubiquinone oxidoreductase subunit B-like Fe-S oxidoreductase